MAIVIHLITTTIQSILIRIGEENSGNALRISKVNYIIGRIIRLEIGSVTFVIIKIVKRGVITAELIRAIKNKKSTRIILEWIGEGAGINLSHQLAAKNKGWIPCIPCQVYQKLKYLRC